MRVNTLSIYTARMKVEVGDQVSRGAALTEGSIQPKRFLPFVMSCLLKLTFLRKYKKYTVAKG